MIKTIRKRRALSKPKTKKVSNYSLIPWDSFFSDIEILVKGYDASTAKEAIKNAVKDKVREFSKA